METYWLSKSDLLTYVQHPNFYPQSKLVCNICLSGSAEWLFPKGIIKLQIKSCSNKKKQNCNKFTTRHQNAILYTPPHHNTPHHTTPHHLIDSTIFHFLQHIPCYYVSGDGVIELLDASHPAPDTQRLNRNPVYFPGTILFSVWFLSDHSNFLTNQTFQKMTKTGKGNWRGKYRVLLFNLYQTGCSNTC